ncbi:hypothetical protein ACTG9Q_19935 [Actinokineospora sp. 24-640]
MSLTQRDGAWVPPGGGWACHGQAGHRWAQDFCSRQGVAEGAGAGGQHGAEGDGVLDPACGHGRAQGGDAGFDGLGDPAQAGQAEGHQLSRLGGRGGLGPAGDGARGELDRQFGRAPPQAGGGGHECSALGRAVRRGCVRPRHHVAYPVSRG